MWARYFTTKPGSTGPGSRQTRSSLNIWIRKGHRWLAIAFTVAVVANFVAIERGRPPAWITYSPLFPLSLLMFTGFYMFGATYAGSRKSAGRR